MSNVPTSAGHTEVHHQEGVSSWHIGDTLYMTIEMILINSLLIWWVPSATKRLSGTLAPLEEDGVLLESEVVSHGRD